MCSPMLARKGIQKKGRMCRMTGPELCSFQTIHILPFFWVESSFNRRHLPRSAPAQRTGVVMSQHVLHQTMHVENMSTHGGFCPHHRLQADRPLGRRKEASRMRTQNPSAFEQTPSTYPGTVCSFQASRSR
ncbi:hypothetical protein NPIL_68981 [Nephila pilipes]|uniref:Uncharacterized protein n=1 Tax=Nephila pilipes TaxID=299642 RepID=A0A8X6MV60_NEPPI|nr:hypothetical protein NPIL_68981 [Nephila pilipes]